MWSIESFDEGDLYGITMEDGRELEVYRCGDRLYEVFLTDREIDPMDIYRIDTNKALEE